LRQTGWAVNQVIAGKSARNAARLACALACALIARQPAFAQVFEIGTAGEVSVRDGGGAVAWHAPGAENAPVSAASPPATQPVTQPATQAATAAFATALQPARIADAMITAAQKYSLHPAVLEALVWQESRWHVNAVSPKGAMGLTQLMPGTARDLGVDPRDPLANLEGGARYLRRMLDRFGGNLPLSLAAYNAGARRVEASGGIPPIRETQGYVAAILNRLGVSGVALNNLALYRPDLNRVGTTHITP